MCLKPISVLNSYSRRHSRPQSRGHNPSNLIYPPLLCKSQTVVVGGLWNCQSAVKKADFISALTSHYSFDFLALTETWISPQNTATPAALSSAYAFTHSPRETGRGGGTGLLLSKKWCFTPLLLSHLTNSSFEFHAISVTSPINLVIIVVYRPPGPLGDFLEEMDTLLSVFPSDSSPLTLLGDFNLPSDKLHSSSLLSLLDSFTLTLNSYIPTHKGGNATDEEAATDVAATPLHVSDHHLVSFTITHPTLPKTTSHPLCSYPPQPSLCLPFFCSFWHSFFPSGSCVFFLTTIGLGHRYFPLFSFLNYGLPLSYVQENFLFCSLAFRCAAQQSKRAKIIREKHLLHADSPLASHRAQYLVLFFSPCILTLLVKLFPYMGSLTTDMLMIHNLSSLSHPQMPQLLTGSQHVWQTFHHG
ncbi:uncharacterized protein LOC132845235 [Tachysurus vachellii]|uniref:uncharacterized protein LOC132845235 n=1 Tax=Tachysurus vachellii TaxID=175792 RepID=UPI00296B2E99|nr:uncharacterized protein LOC132845235 [Tachysurus vachellii]